VQDAPESYKDRLCSKVETFEATKEEAAGWLQADYVKEVEAKKRSRKKQVCAAHSPFPQFPLRAASSHLASRHRQRVSGPALAARSEGGEAVCFHLLYR
jgi:hypothetical protein